VNSYLEFVIKNSHKYIIICLFLFPVLKEAFIDFIRLIKEMSVMA